MYNNIKNFINPRYATLFLFCIVSLLIVIFMKSRRSVEMFVGGDLKKINRMSNDINDLEKEKLNKSDFETTLTNINGRFDSKLNKGEFETTLKDINGRFDKKLDSSAFDITLANNKGFNNKLDKSDFETKLTDINGQVNSKLNKSDFESTLTRIDDRFNNKLNTGDFDQKLADNQTIKTLQNDLSKAPTMSNIGEVVNKQVETRVGDINQAKSDLTNAYGRYDVSMASQYSDYNNNATAKFTAFDDNATAKFTAFDNNATAKSTTFDGNASTKTGILDSNYNSKIGELTALKSAAETAKIAALSAKTDAETAKSETQKMYDDVFKEVSGRVVTQSNVYRTGLTFNPDNGFYERFGTMYDAFELREGFGDDIFNKERTVIQDLNAFNTAYYAWITCKSGKCPTNPAKTESQFRTELETARNALIGTEGTGGSVGALKAAYGTVPNQDDKTQEMIDRGRAIDALRRDLDTKMNAIIKSKNRIDEPAIEYDSTVYAGILWSVLGTSVLYYIFTEL
jgi:hypothetical protein